jgi:Icc-related predicted phosphoesterase
MTTRLIGDIHGKFDRYREIADVDYPTVQVGDFGVGFGGQYWHDRVNKFHSSGQHRFIRGNHDDPSRCRTEMTGYIADGTVENDVMYIGGAWSIDHKHRIPGVDWWEDEELSYSELETLIDVYTAARPRVMITHDCPTTVAYHMFIREGKSLGGNVQILTRTGEALQTMFEIHQPEVWVFGHWHVSKRQEINSTEFICLDELDYVDLEI